MYQQTAKQQANLTFSVFKTADKKVINQFKKFNKSINQVISFPQDNVIVIPLTTHITYLFVIMNSATKKYNKRFQQFNQKMQPYAIDGFPNLAQIQTIQNYLTNHQIKTDQRNQHLLIIINRLLKLTFKTYFPNAQIKMTDLPQTNQTSHLEIIEPINGVDKTYQLTIFAQKGTFDTNLNNPHRLHQLFKYIADMDTQPAFDPQSANFQKLINETNPKHGHHLNWGKVSLYGISLIIIGLLLMAFAMHLI